MNVPTWLFQNIDNRVYNYIKTQQLVKIVEAWYGVDSSQSPQLFIIVLITLRCTNKKKNSQQKIVVIFTKKIGNFLVFLNFKFD
jgi:hypothetical protein